MIFLLTELIMQWRDFVLHHSFYGKPLNPNSMNLTATSAPLGNLPVPIPPYIPPYRPYPLPKKKYVVGMHVIGETPTTGE